jgi:hypothetical protein
LERWRRRLSVSWREKSGKRTLCLKLVCRFGVYVRRVYVAKCESSVLATISADLFEGSATAEFDCHSDSDARELLPEGYSQIPDAEFEKRT